MEHDPNDPIVRRARKRVAMKFGFYIHASVFVLVNGGLFFLNQMTAGARWHHFPLWGWGLGLFIHGVVTLFVLEGDGMRQRMLDTEVEELRRRRAKS